MIVVGLGHHQVLPVDLPAAGTAPINQVLPRLKGDPFVGQILSVSTGDWSGSPLSAIGYQWRRDGSDIAGATEPTFILGASDDKASLSCIVTATNARGAAMAISDIRSVTYRPPTIGVTLADQRLTQGSVAQQIDASVAFSQADGGLWSIEGAGASINADGVVIIPTTDQVAATMVTITFSNSGGSATTSFIVDVVAAVTVPDTFGSADWSVSDKGTRGAVAVLMSAIPGNGGSAITAIEYQVNSGAWTSSGRTTAGTFNIAGLSEGVQVTIKLRARNDVGAAGVSLGKDVTTSIVSGSLADQDAVWGVATSIDAAGGTSGPYAATGLPFGLTIDAITGLITGTPAIMRARSTVSITRNAAEIFNIQMGVTGLAGTAAPMRNDTNLFPDAVRPYDSGTESTAASLINAIKARADADPDPLVGAGNICVRELVWTGGDILKNSGLGTYTADLTPQTWRDRVYIVIDGQGAQLGQVAIRHRNVQIIWKNWRITGLNTGASRNPFYNFAGGSSNFLFNCKVGPYFHPDTTDWASFQNNSTALLRLLGGRGFYGAAFCHFAGFLQASIWDHYGTNVYDVENLFTHFGEDIIRSFNSPADGDVYIYRRGSVATRMITDVARHSDGFQIGAQGASGSIVTMDEEACIGDMAGGRYPSTYIRMQKERGFAAEFNLTLKDTVVRVSGYDAIVNGDQFTTIDGFVAAPPPGAPMNGARIIMRYDQRAAPALPGPAVIKDATVRSLTLDGEWATSGMVMTGASSTYDPFTAIDIEAKFPNCTGSIVVYERMEGLTGVSRYTADYQAMALHPASIRTAVGFQAMPAGGWAAAGCKDPATVPVSSLWGSPPSVAEPSIILTSVTDTAISLTLPGPGIVFYMLDMRDDSPAPPYLMAGVEAKGSFSGFSDQGDLGSTVSEFGRTRFTVGGTQTIRLTGARATGTHTGYVMFEDAVTGVPSLVASASFTK